MSVQRVLPFSTNAADHSAELQGFLRQPRYRTQYDNHGRLISEEKVDVYGDRVVVNTTTHDFSAQDAKEAEAARSAASRLNGFAPKISKENPFARRE